MFWYDFSLKIYLPTCRYLGTCSQKLQVRPNLADLINKLMLLFQLTISVISDKIRSVSCEHFVFSGMVSQHLLSSVLLRNGSTILSILIPVFCLLVPKSHLLVFHTAPPARFPNHKCDQREADKYHAGNKHGGVPIRAGEWGLERAWGHQFPQCKGRSAVTGRRL